MNSLLEMAPKLVNEVACIMHCWWCSIVKNVRINDWTDERAIIVSNYFENALDLLDFLLR